LLSAGGPYARNTNKQSAAGKKAPVCTTKPVYITKIDPPQATHVVNILFNKNECALRRSKMVRGIPDIDYLAPLGTDDCFVMKQFDLVYTIRGDPDYSNLKMPNTAMDKANTVTSVVGTGVVNGLHKNTRLKFVGCIATDFSAAADWKIGMSTAAVASCGSCTTWNSGPYKCYASCGVYFDERPYAFMDASGQMKPFAVLQGGPGSVGTRPNIIAKFVPALYTMETGDAASIVIAALRQIDHAITPKALGKTEADNQHRAPASSSSSSSSSSDALDVEPTDTLTNYWKVDAAMLSDAYGLFYAKAAAIMLERPPSLPLPMIMVIHFYMCMLRRCADMAAFSEIISDVREKIIAPMAAERDNMNKSMGTSSSSQATLFGAFSDPSILDPAEYAEHKLKAERQLLEMRDMHMITVRNWMVDHLIGTCMNDAEPRGVMRVDMRYNGGDR
jgi:hypothetical protein